MTRKKVACCLALGIAFLLVSVVSWRFLENNFAKYRFLNIEFVLADISSRIQNKFKYHLSDYSDDGEYWIYEDAAIRKQYPEFYVTFQA